MPGNRPEHKHRVTQAERTGSTPAWPKNLGFMVGWLVFLGVYQIFLTWKFGTFFEGSKGRARGESPTNSPDHSASAGRRSTGTQALRVTGLTGRRSTPSRRPSEWRP
jgi:hypothetical protein